MCYCGFFQTLDCLYKHTSFERSLSIHKSTNKDNTCGYFNPLDSLHKHTSFERSLSSNPANKDVLMRTLRHPRLSTQVHVVRTLFVYPQIYQQRCATADSSTPSIVYTNTRHSNALCLSPNPPIKIIPAVRIHKVQTTNVRINKVQRYTSHQLIGKFEGWTKGM